MSNKNNKLQKLVNFVIFKTKKGKVNIEVFFYNETLWLTQKLMGKLFEVDRSVITKHLRNIFEEGELKKKSVSANFAHTASDGKVYQTQFYNLNAIISVGYRVNSHQATQFRIWATKVLKEFIVKGFAMDDERLKQIKHLGKDYFEELLERIREIRVSERRLYQKITDIYALSTDYDKEHPMTRKFFASVQNKLHWAISGKTAAEIIYSKADANQMKMGLRTWKNAPDGKILKSDVAVAKNYLNKEHIKQLERIVSAYLDLAENRAQRNIVMNMEDWIEFLNKFLELSDYPILTHKGKVSALEAKIKAEAEYEKFRVEQDKYFESDFDKEVKKCLKQSKKKEDKD